MPPVGGDVPLTRDSKLGSIFTSTAPAPRQQLNGEMVHETLRCTDVCICVECLGMHSYCLFNDIEGVCALSAFANA